ncbi:MAG: FAD-binding molybdopterin dehydrogenase [Saprospiraceae bacterium]|nr:MAG: FAD-binding molybdopterin dehydrogenase [Saprospiraceae bacterium]
MNRFEYIKAPSVGEAIKMMNSTVPEAIINANKGGAHIVKAAGVDLLDLIKEGVVSPDRVIDLRQIPGLDKLNFDQQNGLSFGPMVTIATLAENKEVYKNYRALHEATAHAATPQIRNMATMGGNLMQRPRCWYFRSEGHHCLKKGGDVCFAQKGQNQLHAIFDTQICPCVHPSSIATALVAFDAKVELSGPDGKRNLLLSEFFTLPEANVTCENNAQSKEIITNITLPVLKPGTRSFYIKQGQRESYDWSMGDVAVVLEMEGKQCKTARIVLGAAAPVPMRASKAEALLKGKTITEKLAAKAGELAVEGATPMEHNHYKIQLFKTLVKRSILAAV